MFLKIFQIIKEQLQAINRYFRFIRSIQTCLKIIINQYIHQSQNYCKGMYNLFADRQRVNSQKQQREKNNSMKKYIKNYCEKTRPQLINNYQKRINQFIRRVQHQPVYTTLESIKNNRQSRGRSSIGSRKFLTQTKNDWEQGEDNCNSFRYKTTADWTSIYNQVQRKQRQANLQLFVKKYGNPAMAFRSVGSQSKYKTGYQFRDRSQQKQINPPMTYTNKPTQQVVKKVKVKYRKINQHREAKKTYQLVKKSDGSLQKSSLNISMKGDEQILRSSTPFLHSQSHEGSTQSNDNNNMKQNPNQKRKNSQNKFYFKDMMELEQNISDLRTKKFLRTMLYKCGVYRKKNRKSGAETQVDQFSQFQSVNNLK